MVIKSKFEYLWLAIPIVLAGWSVSRIWTVLPSIMGDEYVYGSASRHLPFAEQFYSNYIYSGIMSLTNICGIDFYGCTKTINSSFFLLAVFFTYLIAARYLSFGWSVFVASVTALSPIAIPVSYFMPEIMYFAFMTGVVLVALFVADAGKWHLWIWVGVALGLSALVKPHALFMLPALSIYALVVSYKLNSLKAVPGLLAAGSTVVGFVLAKFGIGFMFAGVEGLKLFGGYETPIDALTQVVTIQNPRVGEDLGLQVTGPELFLGVATGHLVMHLAAVLMIAGVPVLLSLRVMNTAVRKSEPVGPVSSLFVLVGLITFSMIGVVAVFEAYVTVFGDDHSDRLILRYYEFLLPQFLIMGLLLARFNNPSLFWRVVQGVTVVSATLFFSIFYPLNFDQQYSDSSTLPGFAANGGLFVGIAVLISCAILYWIFSPDEGNLVIGRFVLPIFLIISLTLSQNKLIEINGTPAYFDQAGWGTREYLDDVPGDRILVIGQTRTEVFTVKFWIDEANIKDLLVVEGSVIPAENVSESDYVVTLGNIGVDFAHEIVTEGDGYKLVKVVR